jgi:NRAMP (natural resistance-associated macrophage protein)-like metal ion transporter
MGNRSTGSWIKLNHDRNICWSVCDGRFLKLPTPSLLKSHDTRSIAIVPAIIVTFLNQDSLLGMDTILNILQSVQLPFALVPLIKFVSNKKIMGMFAISRF